jgi:hypothetical protein
MDRDVRVAEGDGMVCTKEDLSPEELAAVQALFRTSIVETYFDGNYRTIHQDPTDLTTVKMLQRTCLIAMIRMWMDSWTRRKWQAWQRIWASMQPFWTRTLTVVCGIGQYD